MSNKMTFKCKSCNNWEKEIPAQWSDVSPRFCGNDTCELSAKKGKGRKSFKSSPEMLEKVMPVAAASPWPTESAPKSKVRTKRSK